MDGPHFPLDPDGMDQKTSTFPPAPLPPRSSYPPEPPAAGVQWSLPPAAILEAIEGYTESVG